MINFVFFFITTISIYTTIWELVWVTGDQADIFMFGK